MADRLEQELLGYLLEALEDSERESVEEQLRRDSKLRRQLGRMRRLIQPLQQTRRQYTPPADLVARTCQFVASHSELRAETASEAPIKRPAALQTGATSAAVAPPSWVSRFSWQDLAAAAVIVAAATLLILPAIENSRFNARRAACEDNLRHLGLALAEYSHKHQDYFPSVTCQGKLAAAGIYVPVLVHGGYLDDTRWAVCPSSPLAEDRRFRVPCLNELRAASGEELQRLRSLMGGSYGFPLGFTENGRYHCTKNLQRPFFALVTDAPSDRLAGHQSINHGGYGQNVLFEDLHTQFLRIPMLRGWADNFFVNDMGFVAPGNHRNDCVIGAGATVPIRFVGSDAAGQTWFDD